MQQAIYSTDDIRDVKFFRIRLLTLSNEEIVEEIETFDKRSKALRKNLIKLCWYMRGGISLEEMYQLGFEDRNTINKVIEDNLEVTKESGLPFF